MGSGGDGDREEVCGEAVVGVKYDLATLLCLSGRSGVGWGEGSPIEREKERALRVILQPVYMTQTSDINIPAS